MTHQALIGASEAANDPLSGISTSGVLSGATDSYIVSRPSQSQGSQSGNFQELGAQLGGIGYD